MTRSGSNIPNSTTKGESQASPATDHNISRRDFLEVMGTTIAGGALAYASLGAANTQRVYASDAAHAQASRPNIVFIITDQERYPRYWPDNWAEDNLPAHQRLAQNGLTVRRNFCSATMCSPSRSTLFTGLHPAQHGVIHTLTEGGKVSPTEPTLPQGIQTMGKMVGSAGYNVVFKGKWHMSKGDDGWIPSADQVAAYGFADWEPTAVADDTAVENFAGGCANWDEKIANQAATFLSSQTTSGTATDPFMLIVGLGNPHDVLSYPNTWDQSVDDAQCALPNNYSDFDFEQGISLPATILDNLDNKPVCQKSLRRLLELKLGPIITPEQARLYANFYAGLIKESDQHIGTVLDAIPEDIRDNTIVIYTSDHGEMGMGHGGLRQKAFQMYEETVNVPLIIHNPVMFPTPKVTDAYTSLIDLMPTIATLAQAPNRDSYTFFGTDLTPLFTEPDTTVQNEILFTFDDIWAGNPDGAVVNPITGIEAPPPPKNIRAIFTQDDDGEWKYARYFDSEGVAQSEYEMYYLRSAAGLPIDEYELDNLANENSAQYNDTKITAKREELAQRLAALEKERLQPLNTETLLPLVSNQS